MGSQGVEARLRLLREVAERQILKPLETHGWTARIESENSAGEYFVIGATKGIMTHKIALLYTSATANGVYKVLDGSVEHIFTNGALYHIEQFAYGITASVSPVGNFFPLLVEWNKQLAPGTLPHPVPPPPQRTVRHITAENPLGGIWSRLEQFGSVVLAEKLIVRRASESGESLAHEVVRAKAAGVAFSLRNAADYLRSSATESLNKRILSLYYGVLSLGFAEMLSSPNGPKDLDEVEGMTKFGHGLCTVPGDADDFGGLSVAVVATGFFPQWMNFLGVDTSDYPRKKPKSVSDLDDLPTGTFTNLRDLFSAVPELGDLFLEVFTTQPSWVLPIYQPFENKSGPGLPNPAGVGSTYIHLLDRSGRIDIQRLSATGWPLAELSSVPTIGAGNEYRARVDHPGLGAWYEALPLHHSPFLLSQCLIVPAFRHPTPYRVNALVILYALSIVVRYMPSAWRRIEGGDWDQHLALIKSLVNIFERILPEQFLETVIGERIHASQPGSWS
ncbi:MAG: hypothetical protein ABSC48_04645 [Terracidiphilus sp.]